MDHFREGRTMSETRKEHSIEYLEGSEEIVGYRTKIRRKEAFTFTGYTLIVPANDEDN